MRAVELRIHNFRSIHDVGLRLEPLSLIAGANNAGKSNIIDAIRLFYGDLKWSEDRDAPKVDASDTESWVEIEFRPTATELAQLKDEYRSEKDTFRVRNYVKPSFWSNGKMRPAGYYAYEREKLSESLFYGAKNVGSGKVGHIVYIPAVSKIDESTKLSGPSVLRELVAEVLNKVIASSPAYQELQHAFSSFERDIKSQESEDGQSLQLLETEITDEIRSWDTTFALGIQSIQPDDIIKALIKPQLIDETHGAEIDQTRFGAGFQRHLIYSLIKLGARHAHHPKKVLTGKKEFSPQLTWILFEEPEAFLHPSQEEVLHDSLQELVGDGVTQVLLTTHSSRFVSRSVNDLTRLIRLRRDAGITTAYQLSRLGLDALFNGLLADPVPSGGDDSADAVKAAQMAALKTELWLQPTRTAAFFADRVILVEGATETGFYSYLMTRGLMKDLSCGLAVVDCLGKFNIHRFMGLMNAFGVDHSVLYDGDNGSSSDGLVTAAIAGAKGMFTKRITRFSSDIETELGIPAERNSSKKPQHLLYHLEAALVDEVKFAAVKEEFVCLATEL